MKLKKIPAILLAALMVVSLLGGCVSSYVDKTTEAPAPQTTEAPKPTDGTSAEPGTTEAPAPATEADISGTKLVVWYAVSGTSGELIKVTVKATSDFSGTHQLWLRNVVGAHETNDASGERVELSDNKTSINPGDQLTGDVTGNGVVGIEDVNAIINIMLGKAQASDYPGIADVTGNGIVGIEDVNAVINAMLGKE